jgi:ligand-binding sensor domain-containing protein
MKLHPVLLSILFLFSSCDGQVYSGTDSHEPLLVTADTVKKLGNDVMIIFQDKQQNYWFGSWKDGLYKYNGNVLLHFSKGTGFPNNRIDEIKEDKDGHLFFNTSSGIVIYDGKKFTMLKPSQGKHEWKLQADDLWFKNGYNSDSICRYDGQFLHQLKLPEVKEAEDYIQKNPGFPNPYSIYSIYKDSRNNMWFGTGAIGAFRYDGQQFNWIIERDVAEILNEPDEPSNGVRSIVEDAAGNFWFNSQYRYEIYNKNSSSKENSSFYRKEKNIGSLDAKPDGNLFEYLSVVKDDHHALWIVTYRNGVFRIDGDQITHYTVQNMGQETTLYAIYKDNAGDLWLGSGESGAYKFNGTSFERFLP